MTENKLIPRDWMVPAIFRARLGEDAGHQRMMADSGHLLLILHESPTQSRVERKARLFWRSPEGVWRASGAAGDGLRVLQQHVDHYVLTIEQLEQELTKAQQAEDFFKILRSLSPILRSTRNLHVTLQQARETFQEAREIIILRDQTYVLVRTAELLDTETKHSLDFTVAQRAEEQSRLGRRIAESGYRLNLLASFFLPITALTALFGMNLSSGVEEVPGMFWFVLGCGVVIGYFLRGNLRKSQ